MKLGFWPGPGFHLDPRFSIAGGFFRALVPCPFLAGFSNSGFLPDFRIFRTCQIFPDSAKIPIFLISPVSAFPRNLCFHACWDFPKFRLGLRFSDLSEMSCRALMVEVPLLRRV